MKTILTISALTLLLSLGFFSLMNTASAQEARSAEDMDAIVKLDEIVQLSEHVYRHGQESNVFIVTSEGIIVVDGTCTPKGAQWFKEELDRRFGVPVKYVILSHDHESHICDTQVFSDTAMTVAHEKALPHIVREGRNSAVPQLLFDETMEIRLGGVRVVLYYFGSSHSDNLIQVHIPDEGVLTATDVVRAGKGIGLPDYRDSNVDGLIDVLTSLSQLENVDIVVPGHGPITDQSSFGYYRTYMIALRDRILDALAKDMTIEEILETVTMDDFSDYGNYDQWLRSNIISMWDNMYRVREPNADTKNNYDAQYPIGFPLGGDGQH